MFFLSREIIFHLHVFFHVFLCFREIKNRLSQIFLRSNVFSSSIFLPNVIIEVQNGNGVLNRSQMSIMHGTILLSTPGQFGPVLLLTLGK